MPARAADLTPEQAAAMVASVAAYEEAMTERTFGLSLMVWGVLVVGVFYMVYAVAAGGPSGLPPWLGLLACLVPVGAGILLTNALWRSRALGVGAGFRPWRIWVQALAIAAVAIAVLFWVDGVALHSTDSSISLAITATLLLGYLSLRTLNAPWRRGHWVLLAALALAVADAAMVVWAPQSLPLPNAQAYTWAALATGAAVFLPGYIHFRQG